MTNLQAELGSAQTVKAPNIIQERRRLAQRYDEAFAKLAWLRTPVHRSGYYHCFQSYSCLFQPEIINPDSISRINESRNAWMDKLQKVGLSTRPATHPVHMLTFYREKYNLSPQDFLNAYATNDYRISLPLFNGMTVEEQNYVIESTV
jgi:perosamine synthetase